MNIFLDFIKFTNIFFNYCFKIYQLINHDFISISQLFIFQTSTFVFMYLSSCFLLT